jgi:hypothetical protein
MLKVHGSIRAAKADAVGCSGAVQVLRGSAWCCLGCFPLGYRHMQPRLGSTQNFPLQQASTLYTPAYGISNHA